jgi:multiple sugar transport system ATP-binding protein
VAGVRFKNVTKVYPGDVTAVKDATLEVYDKELVVLVGPSGCGKSTMLRMVAGLEEVSAGEIYIGDRMVNRVAPKDRDIAMVFQSYALYPHMSVRDNMGFGLKLRKFSKEEIRKRVQHAAELLGLTEYLDRKPKALSGGQRQRVALGRAIVRQPAVFLFDEPLSNLDAALRVQMRTEISKLHRDLDATMVYVTHDQVEAMTMADRIAVLKDGLLQQVDAPLTLYNHPLNRFVASFIGSPAMNFLEGTARAGVFESAGLTLPLTGSLGPAGRHEGRVSLGIRPEDLELVGKAQGQTPGPGTLRILARVVEPMGNEIFLHGQMDETPILARIGPEYVPEVGVEYLLELDTARVHFFDAETGKSLLLDAPVEVGA